MDLEKLARGVNANFEGMRGGAMLAGAAGNNGRPRNSAVIQTRIGGSGITHSGQGRNWAFPAHIEALNNFISESRVTRPKRARVRRGDDTAKWIASGWPTVRREPPDAGRTTGR
jgi:hypothetical protein